MFGSNYFSGFDRFRGLTYSLSMPMVAALLAEHDFDDFECVFGHPGILPPEAEDILAFQAVVRDELEGRLFRREDISDARRRRLYDGIGEGTVRFSWSRTRSPTQRSISSRIRRHTSDARRVPTSIAA